MAIKEETALAVSHRLTLEGRRRLAATGVTDVASFDETAAALETAQGTLILRGRELHVEQLDLEAGQVKISGEVDSMVYEENRQTRESFLSRLFR
jgi:sporulation protein YabP